PLWKGVCPSYAGRQGVELILRELGRLVHENYIVFLPLVLGYVTFRGAVAEHNAGAVGKGKGLFRIAVDCHPRQGHPQGENVVVPQLRKGLTQNKNADSAIAQGHEPGLVPHRPALAPTPGPAVAHKPRLGPEELHLLLVGRYRQCHSASSSRSFPSSI